MTNKTSTDDTERKRVVEMLRRESGVKIPEIAEELSISREKARKLVNDINSEYELGSSADFRYRILDRIQTND